LIVLATDGLWDNMHLKEIHEYLFLTECKDIVLKTKNIIKKIKEYSKYGEYESPFYKKALSQGLNVPKTAKVDDISIIIA
jgi:hypothetical protein